MFTEDGQKPRKPLAIRAYGVSGSTLKKEIETITGVNPGSNAVHTEETGSVGVASEMFGTGGLCGGGVDCYGCDGGGSGGGEGAIVCLILIVAVMAALTIVWAVVMVAFSIMTAAGFFKRRFRTLFVIENENKEFIGKIAVITVQKRGVLEYPFEHREYDEWMTHTFRMFNRLKYLRQISILFGFWWGFFEIAFKLNELVFGVGGYNLWPLRYVMIAIFLPLLLYSPILEIQFRGAFDTGDEMVMRLVHHEPSYSPNQPMKITEAETKKYDYENKS
ncbi:MAG: hypothetical protein ACW987_15060 [Candidatus Thorarchaeota archaeon]